jgi:hypothetical protein
LNGITPSVFLKLVWFFSIKLTSLRDYVFTKIYLDNNPEGMS